jgi:hypothetical protein
MLANLDLDLLLRARLWVARLGESDVNGWWRTDGILGPHPDGAFVGPRVLPRTHATARARIAFATAAHACSLRHPDPKALHLFRLTPEAEDLFDGLLAARLADASFWGDVMPRIEAVRKGANAATVLSESGVVTAADIQAVSQTKIGADGRSLPIAASDPDAQLRLLAAGFTRSQPGILAVPYLEPRAS